MCSDANKLPIFNYNCADDRINSGLSLRSFCHIKRKPHVILVIDVIHAAISPSANQHSLNDQTKITLPLFLSRVDDYESFHTQISESGFPSNQSYLHCVKIGT
ncbi:hypothetical protein D3C78_1174510 [compost metagenome]